MHLIPMRFKDHDVHMFFDEHGNPWWPAHGPCEILGLGNVGQAIGRLSDHQKRIITIDESRPGRKEIWCINESGLYSLLMTSRKPQAKAFQLWLTDEVIPEIRRTGRYELTQERFLANLTRPTQVKHSKDVGTFYSALGGRGKAMWWYRKSLKHITGDYPKEWRETGKAYELPGWVCRRGREVVRMLQPAGACATSLADDLVLHNVNEAEAIAIGQDSKTLFQRMIDAGVTPGELRQSPLDEVGE